MGKLIDVLVGNEDSLDKKHFREIDHTNPAIKSDTKTELKITTVSTKADMLKVEQSIRCGDILIMEIGHLQGSLTKEELLNYLHDTITKINGDIVQRNEYEYIISPSSIQISRSKL